MMTLHTKRKLAKIYLGTLTGALLALILWLTFVSPVAAIIIGGGLLLGAILIGVFWAIDVIWSGGIDTTEYD